MMNKMNFKWKDITIFCVALSFIVSCCKDKVPMDRLSIDDSPSVSHIWKVYDFMPAVGQFTNKMPEYELGDTQESMNKKAESMIKGKGTKPAGMISLGGFGGYVVFGFEKMVINMPGYRDFRVLGNAFWADANPNANASSRGGSSEAGVILVSYDTNKNGLPDDEWYEIAGSEYSKSIKDYEITYYKPDPAKAPLKNEKDFFATDVEYIRWEDNQQNSGFKVKNQYHSQSYFPEWVKADKITFIGTLLPNSAVDESGTGSYWVQYSFNFGYADNVPNNDVESAIDIDWAVDAKGNKVQLPGINFVKVYSGVNQESGWLGEVSTEIAGAYDLHILGIKIKTR